MISDSLYTGTYRGIPADAISITTYADPPTEWDTWIYHVLLVLLTTFLAFRAGAYMSRTFASSEFGAVRRFLLAGFFAMILCVIYLIAYSNISNIPGIRAGAQATPPYGYGGLGVIFLVFVVGWPVLTWLFLVGFKREKYRLDEEETMEAEVMDEE
jgi:hypothetical protein